MTPIFSIIIPTYNRGDRIVKTLRSCIDQDFKEDFEIIVVDDGSTDQTASIFEKLTEPNVFYFKKKNEERGAARNYGVKKAKGKYITFLDSDDLLYQNHLSNAFSIITSQKDTKVFHLGYEIKSEKGDIQRKYDHIPSGDLNRHLLKGNYMSCIGVFIRRDIALNHPFSETRSLSGTEDWLLWLKLAARYPIHYITAISATMIDHDDRSIHNFADAAHQTRRELLLSELRRDDVFVSKFGEKALRQIEAHMLTYSGLHLMLSKRKMEAWQKYFQGIRIFLPELFSRRTLAMIKHTLS